MTRLVRLNCMSKTVIKYGKFLVCFQDLIQHVKKYEENCISASCLELLGKNIFLLLNQKYIQTKSIACTTNNVEFS
jgi:hypothetical protein